MSKRSASTELRGDGVKLDSVTQKDNQGHFAGRERDEKEVLGYYAALDHTEMLVEKQSQIRESDIKRIHALVMGGGKQKVKPTAYRDAQNVIRDSSTRSIVYMPPEAKDVGTLRLSCANGSKLRMSYLPRSKQGLPTIKMQSINNGKAS